MNRLRYLQQCFFGLPPQGSAAWLESRRSRLGGSEVAAALGRCKYQSRDKLIASKRAQTRLVNAACTFGTIFERVAKEFLAQEKEWEIHELGAVPSARFPVAYSADGLVVEGEKLVLLEIKCPFRRSSIQTVPAHYLPQVLSGLAILPCDEAAFLQFRFRMCRRSDIGGNRRYNRWIHVESRQRAPDAAPLRWGYLHWDGPDPVIDLGALTKVSQDGVCVVRRRPFAVRWEAQPTETSGFLMGFKLFGWTDNRVPPEKDYLEAHQATLWECFDALQ